MNMLTIFYADILNLKVKWALPTGIVNVMAFEQKATSYLFGFSDNGLTCFLFTAIGTLQTIYSFRGVK